MKGRAAVLFDVDGVLVQTEPLRAKAHTATVRSFGGRISVSFYFKIGATGKSHDKTRAAFIKQSKIFATPESYTKTFRKIFRKLLKDIAPVPGIPQLLRLLRHKDCLLGAVSSSESAEVKEILKRASLAKYFSIIVCGNQVAHKKPAPDLYVLALSRLRIEPASTVVVEDSDSGVQAALAAGLKVLAFRHRYNKDHCFTGVKKVFGSFRNTERLANLILASFPKG